jgi:hypothetical protein
MAFQIKIKIREIKPEIFRRLIIPEDITFKEMHQIIQAAFGWLDYHAYRFEFGDSVISIPDERFTAEELYGREMELLDSETTGIDMFFYDHNKGLYEYDFGDMWQHEVKIERVIIDEEVETDLPTCTGGARERPPEDVGGTGGYYEFLKTISDESDPERKETLTWAEKDTRGRIYDPEYFNINEVNRRLMYALENDYETAAEMLTGRGLTGVVSWGWTDAVVKIGNKPYSMEQIGNMMLRLGEGSRVTIKVVPPKE